VLPISDFNGLQEELNVNVYLKRTFLEGRVVHYLFPVSLIGKQGTHSHGHTDVFLAGIHFSDQWNKCQLHVI
jgi:hypothetical protein